MSSYNIWIKYAMRLWWLYSLIILLSNSGDSSAMAQRVLMNPLLKPWRYPCFAIIATVAAIPVSANRCSGINGKQLGFKNNETEEFASIPTQNLFLKYVKLCLASIPFFFVCKCNMPSLFIIDFIQLQCGVHNLPMMLFSITKSWFWRYTFRNLLLITLYSTMSFYHNYIHWFSITINGYIFTLFSL